MSWFKWMAALFALIGTLMLCGGLASAHNARQLVKHGVRASGEVVEVVREESRETTEDANGSRSASVRILYYPLVQFERPDGAPQRFKSRSGANNPQYRVGQAVPVIYRAAQPQDARIESWGSLWGFALGLLVLGAIFAAIGVGLLLPPRKGSAI